jgi:hypothetical protein
VSALAPAKTFSFKAPRDWDERIERARETLSAVPELDGPDGARILHELELAVLRRPHVLTRASSQSDFMRALVELVVAATEKLERDRVTGEEYAAAAAERAADEVAFTRASRGAALRRWHRNP